VLLFTLTSFVVALAKLFTLTFILTVLRNLLKESNRCKPDCTVLTAPASNRSIVETSRDFQWKREGLKGGLLCERYANTISVFTSS